MSLCLLRPRAVVEAWVEAMVTGGALPAARSLDTRGVDRSRGPEADAP